VTVEVEAPGDGVLAGVKSREGEDVPVGQTIAWIVAPGEKPPADGATAAPTARAMTGVGQHSEAAAAKPEPPKPEVPVRASPKAKRMAKELGVDLAKIKGTG